MRRHLLARRKLSSPARYHDLSKIFASRNVRALLLRCPPPQNVPTIVPVLEKEYRNASRRLEETQVELHDLHPEKLKVCRGQAAGRWQAGSWAGHKSSCARWHCRPSLAGLARLRLHPWHGTLTALCAAPSSTAALQEKGRVFRESFLSKLQLLLRGTVAAPPERFGETLADEHIRGAWQRQHGGVLLSPCQERLLRNRRAWRLLSRCTWYAAALWWLQLPPVGVPADCAPSATCSVPQAAHLWAPTTSR